MPPTKKKLNRIKEVIEDSGYTSKWLAEKLDVNPVTVAKWSTNTMQPTMENLFRIAKALDVNVQTLLVATK